MESTVAQVAAQLHVTPGRIRQVCRQHGIGRIVTERLRLLSEQDVKKLAKIIPSKRGPKPNVKKSEQVC